MRKVTVVTDSASGIPTEAAKTLGIRIIPMQIVDDATAYTMDVDISSEEVYARMRAGKVLKTTQPLIPHIEEAYREALGDAERVISVHISSKLTSTMATCKMVADMVAPDRIEVMDSSSLSVMYGLPCMKAARLALDGCSADEAGQSIRNSLRAVRGWLAVPSLKHLSRSGRVSKVISALSSLLSIKVILRMEGGEVGLEDKYRSNASALLRLVELATGACSGKASALAVVHGDNPAEADRLKMAVIEAIEADDFMLGDISPIVGVHTGPGPVGLVVIP